MYHEHEQISSFGMWLRRQRKARDWTQADLAQRIGCTSNMIRKIETDIRRPSKQLATRITKAFALPPAECEAIIQLARGMQTLDYLPPAPQTNAPAPQAVEATPAPRAAEAAPTPLRHQLRTPLPDFVGQHSAFTTLIAALRHTTQDGSVATIIGVRGMGGIGKTELAVLVANHLTDVFPDAQIVVSLRGTSAEPLPPEQALRQVIHACAPDAKLADNPATLQAHYLAVLHGQRALILADDAADAVQVRWLLPPAGCALLITSRQRFSLPGMLTIDLAPLDEQAAVTLLRGICARLNAQDAYALAQACGYLPLALRISGCLLHNNPALEVATHLEHLLDERQRLRSLRDPDDRQLDMEASLALSYARLAQPAQRVFRQLGVLVADFATPLAQEVVEGAADGDVVATLHNLLRRNLIMYDAHRSRWRLHDLVRDLARRELVGAGGWEPTMWRYAQAAVRLAEETQVLYQRGGDNVLAALTRFDQERAHIDAGRSWAASQSDTAAGEALLLADACATFPFAGLRYDPRRERLPQLEAALSAAQRLGDRGGQATILNQLGRIHHFLGDAGLAIEYYAHSLAIARAIADRSGEASALNSLGTAYAELGQLRRAISYFEQRLAIARDIGDRCGQGGGLCNLAIVAMLLGDARQALAYFEPALACFRALGNQAGEATVLGNLGSVYLELGDARKALGYFEPALACFRAQGNRGGEARFLTELGRAYLALGNDQRAFDTCAEACVLFREIGAQREEGYALHALGATYAARGDLVRAWATFEQALACFCAVGDLHGAATCRWEFGQALAGWGERERALPLLRAALAYEQEIGHIKAPDHAALLARLEAGEDLSLERYILARQ